MPRERPVQQIRVSSSPISYQNNYRVQLANCLEDSFAVTLAWLGGEAFHAAIVAHVEAIPPSSWTLDLYGKVFPVTLRRLYPDDPEVGHLATIEAALSEAFVAGDAAPLAADLTAIDWDRAMIGFVPSLTVHPLTSTRRQSGRPSALASFRWRQCGFRRPER